MILRLQPSPAEIMAFQLTRGPFFWIKLSFMSNFKRLLREAFIFCSDLKEITGESHHRLFYVPSHFDCGIFWIS